MPRHSSDCFAAQPTNGGLWFASAACTSEFGQPGEIPQPRVHAFARCLAELKLQPSHRENALGDVVVMTYEPGFEIEARVVSESDGPRLSWIGFASRRNAADNDPTITNAAFESLRTEGDRNGPIEPALAATLELDEFSPAITWLKICLDETGAVRSVVSVRDHVREDLAGVRRGGEHVVEVQALHDRRASHMPVCSMVRLAYPATSAPPVETLPLPPPPSRSNKDPIVFSGSSKLVEGNRIAGTRIDRARRRHEGRNRGSEAEHGDRQVSRLHRRYRSGRIGRDAHVDRIRRL